MPRPQSPARRWWRCSLTVRHEIMHEADLWTVRLSCVVRIQLHEVTSRPELGDLVERLLVAHRRDCGAPIARACDHCGRRRSPENLVAERPDRAVCREWTPCLAAVARQAEGLIYREGEDGPQPRRESERW